MSNKTPKMVITPGENGYSATMHVARDSDGNIIYEDKTAEELLQEIEKEENFATVVDVAGKPVLKYR